MSKFVELMQSATAEDLAELQAEIDVIERKLAGLKAAHRLVSLAVNGAAKPGPAKGSRPAANGQSKSANLNDRRERVVKYLAEAGPCSHAAIAHNVGIPEGSIYAVLNHEWFSKTNQGFHITPQARQDVL